MYSSLSVKVLTSSPRMKSNQYAVICNVTRLASKTGNLEMHTADYEVTQLENVIELIKNIRKH